MMREKGGRDLFSHEGRKGGGMLFQTESVYTVEDDNEQI